MVARQQLASLPAFRNVPSTDLEILRVAAPPVSFAAGTVLFRRGDPAMGAFLLVSGRCRAEVASEGRATVLGHAGPGQVIGEAGLFRRDTHRSATVVAEEAVEALLLMPGLLDQPSAQPVMRVLERRALATLAERVRTSTATFQRLSPATEPDRDDPGNSLLDRLRKLLG